MEKTTLAYEPEAEAAPKTLTLKELFQEKIFQPRDLRDPQWMQDGQRFSYLDEAPGSNILTIWMYDVRSGERKPLLPAEKLRLPKERMPQDADDGEEGAEPEDAPERALRIRGYQWSPDETRILFARSPRRRASQGDKAVFVYSLAAQELRRVTDAEKEHRNVKWSPDGKRIGFVRDDDLWMLDLATGRETRLTDTAAPAVYNGRFGWVYEEELDLADGWAWSPDSKFVAYFQMDERPVPLVFIENYGDLHNTPKTMRYPKAGDPNPIVRIGVVAVPPEPTATVPPTRWIDLGPDADIYIARMQWSPQGDLLLQRMPRLQNRIELLKADPQTGAATVVLAEEDKAWVDPRGDLTFVKGTNQFLWWSDRDGWRHLYLYDLSGRLHRQLTRGAWDVENLAGVDSQHRIAYFTAARPNPMERHLFSVLLDGGGDVIQISGDAGIHRPKFSPDAGHFLDTHSSRAAAPTIRLHRSSGYTAAVVRDNPMPKLQGHRLGTWEFHAFKTRDGLTLHAGLLKPRDFDPKKRYPVLITTYGGPGSQMLRDEWGGGGWDHMMGQKGYLIAAIDGRGSEARGRDFLKCTYQRLGQWEVHDQIEGAQWLGGLPYVDAKRIGIWGWSYGGYMAALGILRGADVFKAAIAVAPVTDWALYDSIYTERYMRRPKDNPQGYKETAPLHEAEKLKGKFLLVHGMADDNVHFQNSARLAAEFQKRNRPFRAMFYPGKQHGIEGVSEHLFEMMTDFIVENL